MPKTPRSWLLRLAGEFFLWLLVGYLCWWGLFFWLVPALLTVDPLTLVLTTGDTGYLLPIPLAVAFGYRLRRRYRLSPGYAALVGLSGMGLLVLANGIAGIVGRVWGTVPPDPHLLRKSVVTLAMMVIVGASSALGAWWASRLEPNSIGGIP